MITFLSIFWLIRTTKALLFWVYLWQLKDYHVGRFIDHFRTAKGKQIFLNPLFLGKLVLFVALFLYSQTMFLLLGIYILEGALTLRALLQRRLLKPAWTVKTGFLVLFGLGIEIVFLGVVVSFFGTWYLQLLLGFDILAPKIFSFLVLFLQPWVVVMRNRVIAKARKKREQFPNLLVIGITGSYGKTTTKEFLAHILSRKFSVLRTKDHQNSEVGISSCILQELNEDHKIFVCEMGAYNKRGIALLASIAKPKIAVLTGVNEQHLATFGSMENLLSAEGGKELVDSLPKDGVVIVNENSGYLRDVYRNSNYSKRFLWCNTNSAAAENMLQTDFGAEDIRIEKERIFFRVMEKEGDHADFEVELLGGYNIENILLSVAVARELGMDLSEIAEACRTITPDMGAMKLRKGINGLNVIESTYSANPNGVIAALDYLNVWPRKKIIVMPCLIELGKASKEVHKKMGEKIAQVCDLAIITTKDKFKEVIEGARLRQGFGGREIKKDNILFLENPKEIFEKIKSFCQDGDIILLESRIPSQLISLLIQ